MVVSTSTRPGYALAGYATVGSELLGDLLTRCQRPDRKDPPCHRKATQSIDFVLAFPQADLDTDIWMEIPPGFEAEDRAVQTKQVLKI